jgi:predicted AlkP superfamily phosphohydrolase/phosphomutase
MSERKVLVIGMDGGTWAALDVFAPVMPNLQRLKAGSGWGLLESTMPPITAPAWTTFMTGTDPGKHGCYYFTYLQDGRLHTINSTGIHRPTFLQLASRAGKHVICLNLPMTYPPQPVNGVVVTGMLTPAAAQDFVYPPDARALLGDYRPSLPEERETVDVQVYSPSARRPAWRRRFIDCAATIPRRRGECARRLLGGFPWDIGVIVFTTTDRVQHQCWLSIEGGTESWRPDEREQLKSFYSALDDEVGKLLRSVPEETTVIMVSDHGFGQGYSEGLCEFHVNCWLRDTGYLAMRADEAAGRTAAPRPVRRGLGYRIARAVARRLMSPNQRKALRQMVKGDFVDAQNRVDWPRSRAFSLVYGNTAAGHGSIYLGEAATESTLSEVAAALRGLTGPDGGPVFSEVHLSADLYGRDAFRPGPDIVYETRLPYLVRGDFDEPPDGWFRMGETTTIEGLHRRHGIFLARGAEFEAGGPGAWRMCDVAPTVLAACGLKPPEDMDGVVRGGFRADDLAAIPDAAGPELVGRVWSADEEEDVKARLRDLGYMA